MTIANARVLVLNRNWVPVNVVSAFDAIAKVFAGRAQFLDTETFATFDFESWVTNWDEAIRTAKIASEKAIKTPRFNFLVPEIIICADYRGFGYKVSHRKPKFSRSNIFRRDKNICQLCGKKFKTEELTMEHVLPKSKGGTMVWENIVLACVSCNNRKGDKTLAEAGLRLIKKPVRPTADELKRSPMERIMHKIGRKPPQTWQAFLDKMYWNAELKE